jgi:hypothetical protein
MNTSLPPPSETGGFLSLIRKLQNHITQLEFPQQPTRPIGVIPCKRFHGCINMGAMEAGAKP